MLKKGKYYLLAFTLLILGCAKFGSPGGGPNDTTPPEILWTLSDANYQTNFNQSEIKLQFNEWVTVNNPLKEVVVSPPLANPFSLTTKGKAVIFKFGEGEELKDDVTYQINFGNAIKDFSAGNILKNQIFVFSTGDVIDSLEIGGTVYNELTGEPVEDATVVVYDDLGDSVLYLQKPFYFAKTDKQGKFQIRNMRSDTFQIYGLMDNNVSYTYDLPEEQVAFYDTLIYTQDTTNSELILYLFDEEEDLRLIDYRHERRGIYKIKYDRVPTDYVLSLDREDIAFYSEVLRDTIYVYHDASSQDSFNILIDFGNYTDTLQHKKARKGPENPDLKFFDPRSSKMDFHSGDSLVIEMNHPIVNVDTSLITISDTTDVNLLTSAIPDVRMINLFMNSKANSAYQLTILPGALEGMFTNENIDTLTLEVNTFDPSKFGRIGITVDSLRSGNYIAQLLDKNNIVRELNIDTSYLEFNRMAAGSYQLKIIEDSNGDGKWSPGSLSERRRSERQGTFNLEELKEGWDLELTVNLKTVLDGT